MKYDTLIVIKEGGNSVARKISLVQPYPKENGFAVRTPYHVERKGYLAKIPVNYDARFWKVRISECERYTAEHRVKLSYHANGFLQFSSEGGRHAIRSGRDQTTGDIKGMGLITKPLCDPIVTGPSFGIQVWGLDDFEPLRTVGHRNVVTITPADVLYRLCTPETANAYLIEGFIFPPEFKAAVQNRNGRLMMTVFHGFFREGPQLMDFMVIPLPDRPFVMAILASRMCVSTPNGLPPSGFMLSSASDSRHLLYAFYPPPTPWPDPGQSLNYCPVPTPPPDGETSG